MSSSLEANIDQADVVCEEEDSSQASNSQLFDTQQPNGGVTAQDLNLMKELCRCLSPVASHDDVVGAPTTMDSILQEVYEYMGQEEKQDQGLRMRQEHGDTDITICQSGLDQELRMRQEHGEEQSGLDQGLRMRQEHGDTEVVCQSGLDQEQEHDPDIDASSDAELGNVLLLENALKVLETMRRPAAETPALENELENVLLLEKALKKVNGNLSELTAMSRALKRLEEQDEEQEEQEDLVTTDLERALESCPLILDDEDFSRRFQTIEAWAAQQVAGEESGCEYDAATLRRPESFKQEEEVTKSAKNLFAKKTKTLFHWLHPEDSKADLRLRVERAWHKLSQKESEFYYSQVLGPFNHRQVKPMINPRIFELLNLPMSARHDAAPPAASQPPSASYRKPAATAVKPVKPPKPPRPQPAPRKKRGPYNKTPKHLREPTAAGAAGEEARVKRHRGPNKKKQAAAAAEVEVDDDEDEEARKRKKKLKRERREEREANEKKRKGGCSEGSDDEDWNVARKRRKKARRERRRATEKEDVMKTIARRFLREEGESGEGESDWKVIVERLREPVQPEKEHEISAELTRDLAECDKMLDSDDSW